MAGTRRIHTSAGEGRVNLTPMVDVVFQLIIFFMLVTELSNLALEPVTLPWAPNSVEPQPTEGKLTINISRKLDANKQPVGNEGQVVIFRETVPGVGSELINNLKEKLQVEAQQFKRWTPNPLHPTGRNSELEVLVRSDRQVRSEYFLNLMWACNDVGIYKVQVAAHQQGHELMVEE